MPAKKKPVKVTRKFMLDLASSIYNPKTRRFLNLCTGTLQNGPDPKDPQRTMHCGLGELYFAMTGMQPDQIGVRGDDIIELTIELSPLKINVDAIKDKVIQKLEGVISPDSMAFEMLTQHLSELDDEEFEPVATELFRAAINKIVSVNDSVISKGSNSLGGYCTPATFRIRAQHVAKQLRIAAKLLPA